jgi:hypothetical protein
LRHYPVEGRRYPPAPIDLPDEDHIVSHIVEIQAEVRDPAAVAAACRRLALPEPAIGTARLFEGEATGLLVKLPGWLYPLVCETGSGRLRYDNFGGRLGRARAARPLPPGVRPREGQDRGPD